MLFDKDLNLIAVGVDSAYGFSRSIAVSPDGNTIYDTGYTTHVVSVYTRPDEFSPFAKTSEILKGFDSESMLYRADTGYLWASAGSYNDLPNRYPGVVTDWKPNSWYAYDVANKKVVDRIDWQFNTPNNINERPRGIAFSPDGNTAYVTCFGASDYPIVQKFVKVGTGVDDKESGWVHVETFQLFQNYPNPFNPQTTIPFELKNPGQVQVKVFDMTGREVMTLVDHLMPSGSHNLVFDAKGLASGTYYYRLIFSGQTLTKRMLFVK
ncbi:MAG: T9SS type A sorting domain-containing protein [bacterium]